MIIRKIPTKKGGSSPEWGFLTSVTRPPTEFAILQGSRVVRGLVNKQSQLHEILGQWRELLTKRAAQAAFAKLRSVNSRQGDVAPELAEVARVYNARGMRLLTQQWQDFCAEGPNLPENSARRQNSQPGAAHQVCHRHVLCGRPI